MTESQKDYGRKIIMDYARVHNITYKKALEIIDDTRRFEEIWNWVNCDEFLNMEMR